jgi:LysM repeat protein
MVDGWGGACYLETMRRAPAKPWFAVVLAVVCIGWTGCGNGARESREERDPILRKARERKNAQDFEGAAALYAKAIEKKPALAQAHLELGLLYDQNLEQYVRAIYHYERYLELDPKAEKREIVEELMRVAKLSFAASLPDKPAEAVREIAMLKEEIEWLKDQLGQRVPERVSPAPTAAVRAIPPVPPVAPVAAKAAPAPAATQQTYTVQVGDTLSRIAGKVYGDSSKWKPIFEANRNVLPNPQSIRVGQPLVIPKP